MTDNTAKQEVNAYLQNLEDTGFFKEDEPVKEDTAHHAALGKHGVTVLPNGMTTEVISLSEQGMNITEYLQSLASSGNAPSTVLVSTANGELIRNSVPTQPTPDRHNEDQPIIPSRDAMRISVNDMVTDDDIILFRKPATQTLGVSIMDEMNKLLNEVKE